MKLINSCEYDIPENLELDYDFGYLVGAYCAEGCMTKHQISIANNDDEYLIPVQRWCEKHNITTKVYCTKNKIQEGWTSQDVRIYNTVLCRILSKLCGNLSHNKFVSDKIIFSNRECILGFLDAYIGGDGCVHQHKRKDNSIRSDCISASSVSYKMLLGVQIMLKNLGIISKINKTKKAEKNNRGTKPENIKQPYQICISNKQSQKLAELLNMKPSIKNDKAKQLLKESFKYEYNEKYLTVPNIINGEVVMESRDNRFPDTEFDRIVSIEEVSNTTSYAYDLTVEDTRTFDCMNGLNLFDTFHLAGVASKSNVTRGVPRIEEILRLTKNPKNPSLTVHLKPLDELVQDRAAQYANMLEHTKLVDVIKSVQICFDPNDNTTTINDDRLLMEQYYEFENMVKECIENNQESTLQKSKWIIRLEVDAELLLDKNITMDDIHFAITNSYGNDITCVYSDYNSNNLVFRIRLNSNLLNKNKKQKGIPDTLDQSDEIYLLRNFQEMLLNNIVLRGVQGIRNVIPRKLQNYVIKDDGKYNRKDIWILDTTGSNLMSVLGMDFIDTSRTYSNDIKEIFDVLGIEAARQILYNEFVEVMEFSDVYINYHHLSLLTDRMTSTQNMVPIFRSGILNDDIGPISKSTFEVHTEVLLGASRHADFDHMRGVSANVMMGQLGIFGTGAFQLVLDMEQIKNKDDLDVNTTESSKEIENLFGNIEDTSDICSKKNIEIRNNLSAIKPVDMGECNDGYDVGF
jgi:DNA-directed RNA polymerase beta' subunit